MVILLRDEGVCASINEQHLNSHYFPDHTLPINVRGAAAARRPLFAPARSRDRVLQPRLWACVYTEPCRLSLALPLSLSLTYTHGARVHCLSCRYARRRTRQRR